MAEAAPRLVQEGGSASKPLVWVDLEMTGLDPETCAIVEIATIVTDEDLAILAEGPCLVIRPPDEALARMSSFVRELHGKSGLLERIQASTVTLADAQRETLAFLERHAERGTSPLCGNSVWKDRTFLERQMPEVVRFLHYRMIDVSTLKELVRRWYPAPFHPPKKREVHRALDDIRESIEELRWYRSRVFVPPPSGSESSP
jgi:oligoribonuclease